MHFGHSMQNIFNIQKYINLGIKFTANGKYLAPTERFIAINIHWFNVNGMNDLFELLYKFVIYTPRGMQKIFEYSAYDSVMKMHWVFVVQHNGAKMTNIYVLGHMIIE